MVKSVSTPKKKDLTVPFVKTHLTLLRNWLRHNSASTTGRAIKRGNNQYTWHAETSKTGIVRVSGYTPPHTSMHPVHFSLELRGEDIKFEVTQWQGREHVPWGPTMAMKHVRKWLGDTFPGYTEHLEEWTPPIKPINERRIPQWR